MLSGILPPSPPLSHRMALHERVFQVAPLCGCCLLKPRECASCSATRAVTLLHHVFPLSCAVSGIMQLLCNILKLIKASQPSRCITHHGRRMIATVPAASHCLVQGLQQNSINRNTPEMRFLTKGIC